MWTYGFVELQHVHGSVDIVTKLKKFLQYNRDELVTEGTKSLLYR